MEGYCLRTHLIEKPSVCLYYKGMENDSTSPDALNVVVAFTPAEALLLDDDVAKSLCQRLNRDREILQTNGYGEFETIRAICLKKVKLSRGVLRFGTGGKYICRK